MQRLRWLAIALLLGVALWPPVASGQAVKAGVVTTLEGTVTAARATSAQPVALKFKDDVFLQDRITTGERSLVRVLLGGKALVTVRERSMLTITEVPGRSTIDLQSGKIGLSVARDRLRSGESVEIRTTNAVAGIRGTVVVAEAVRDTTRFYVLRGSAEALQLNPATGNPLSPARTLNVLESFNVTGSAPGQVAPITPDQIGVITSGLQPDGPQHKDPANQAQVTGQAVQTAAALVSALIGPPPSGQPPSPSPTQQVASAAAVTGPPVGDVLGDVLGFSSTITEPGRIQPATSPAGGGELGSAQPPDATAFHAIDIVPGGSSTPSPGGPMRQTFSGGTVPTTPGLPLVQFASGSFTDTSTIPFLTLDNTSLVQSGSENFVQADAGSQVTLAAPIADVTQSTLTVGSSVLDINGAVTSTAPGPFVSFDSTTVVTGSDFLRVGPGGSLSLVSPASQLLTDVGGSLLAGRHFLNVDGGTLAGAGTASLLQFTSSHVTANGDFIRVGGPPVGGAANLSVVGSLLKATDSALTAGALLGSGLRFESNVGPTVLTCDDCVTQVSFGFAFPFRDGRTYTGGELSSNGFLSLGGSNGQGCCDGFVAGFLAGAARIALAWYDLDPRFGNGLHFTALPGRAVATWLGVPEFGLSGSSNTLQMQLFPDGRILFSFVETQSVFHNVLVGVTTGGGAADPGPTDLSASRVFATTTPTVYEQFLDRAFDLSGTSLLFTPAGDSGWTVELAGAGDILALGNGARVVQSGGDPLVDLLRTSVTAGGYLLSQSGGSLLTLGGPLLRAVDSPLSLGGGLVLIRDGAQLVSGSTAPLVTLAGNTHSLATGSGAAMFDLAGTATTLEVLDGVTITRGSERPLQHAGPLLETSGATVTGEKLLSVDTALLEASAPILNLLAGSVFSTNVDAVDLSRQAKVTSVGPILKLDGSTLTVRSGAAVNVAGGSALGVAGDLIQLVNGSTLSVLNGPLLSVAGGSVVNISGALVAFGGTGRNSVNVTNSLCAPCTLLGGIPVALSGGATSSNVRVGANAFVNGSAPGTVTLSNPTTSTGGTAVVVVSGSTSKVTIGTAVPVTGGAVLGQSTVPVRVATP